ncbi:hypothetical protein J2Z23_000028 [Lederbergia galactosidilyticus]|nr:hypothetical protein [Lederbergia galactosidilytica]
MLECELEIWDTHVSSENKMEGQYNLQFMMMHGNEGFYWQFMR